LSLIFADTSALVKRYVHEVGSAWVRSWCELRAGNTVVLSELATVEVVSGLARRQRDGSLRRSRLSRLHNDFLLHVEEEYLIFDLRTSTILIARDLALRHPLQALDARQVVGSALVFVSADLRLLAAAALEGFPTDNPNAH
jgi:predicted nucleic acid-binding protein